MRILIRATNWVGDAIISMPAIRAVREKFPEAYLAILARPHVVELYGEQGLGDDLIAYDWRGAHRGWSGRERLAAELREKKFDVALLLQNAFDAGWLVWRAGVPERIGYARDFRSWLLTKAVPVPKHGEIPGHEKVYYLELLRRVGWIDGLPDVEQIALRVSEKERFAAAEKLGNAGSTGKRMRVAIAAGAAYGSAKCWDPGRFAAVATRLQKERDADVLLFGAAGEVGVCSAIAAAMERKPIDLSGQTSVGALPALFSQCQLFLGNDSGAMHVAAAVGLPVVTIFGPTDPFGTAPVTQRVSLVQEKPYCSPCFLRHCPTDHRCMKAVTPAMAEAAIDAQLACAEVGSA
jgi:heptosyltransferase II